MNTFNELDIKEAIRLVLQDWEDNEHGGVARPEYIVEYFQQLLKWKEEHNKAFPLTPEYLESKNFIKYVPGSESKIEHFPALFDILFNPETDLCYIENKLDRKQFCIVLTPSEYGNGDNYYAFEIYIQDDIGCGFINIPNQFCEMTEYHFELLYEAIRREKL